VKEGATKKSLQTRKIIAHSLIHKALVFLQHHTDLWSQII